MATQLFLLHVVADTHLGTDNTTLPSGTASWRSLALGLARGSGSQTASNPTVTGPTLGITTSVNVGSLGRGEWISPPVAADVTISGTITANIWALESNMSANVAINVLIEIIRANTLTTRDSNTLVTIVKSTNATEVAVTTAGVNNFTTGMTSGAYTAQTLNRGDRLRIQVFGDDVGTMATGYNFEAHYNGATAAADGDTYVTFTENITFESTPTLVLAQTTNGAPSTFGWATSLQRLAQPFVAQTTSLIEVRTYLNTVGSPTDDVVLEIQTDSSGSPSGSAVGTVATVTAASLTSTATEYTYSCSVALTVGVTYWLVYRRSGSLNDSNHFGVRTAGSAVTGWSPYKYFVSSWVAVSGPLVVRFEFFDSRTRLYLTDMASAVATASLDKEAWTSRGSGSTTADIGTVSGWTAPIQLKQFGTVVDWFTRPLTAFTLTGMAVANLRSDHAGVSSNATVRCEIARVEGDGTSPTVWASWCIAPTGTDNGAVTTTETARTVNISGDDLAISNGQRLRIRLYADDISSAAMASANTLRVRFSGATPAASGDSYITFPQTLTEYVPAAPHIYIPVGYAQGRDY